MGRKFRSTAPPPAPPANAAEGAARVRGLVMKLFDKGDGDGANWRLLAESLFKAAFDGLDRLPDDQKQALARRVHAGAYERMAGHAEGEFSASKTADLKRDSGPSNTAGLQSPGPRPPR